jgi:hypothetical protein
VQRVENVEPRRATRGHSASVTSAERNTPSPSPSAVPIGAVMTLSWRIMRRARRRVMPMVRSIPISRVRSKTEHHRVDHPEQAHDHREAEQHVEHREHRGQALRGVLGYAAPVWNVASPKPWRS